MLSLESLCLNRVSACLLYLKNRCGSKAWIPATSAGMTGEEQAHTPKTVIAVLDMAVLDMAIHVLSTFKKIQGLKRHGYKTLPQR
jgi:hypothetical protein